MPCNRCDSPLLVSQKYEDLRCPNCLDLGYTSSDIIRSGVDDMRDLLGEDAILGVLKEYKKTQVILALLRMGNKAANQIWEHRGIPLREFTTPPQFLKFLLPETGFGTEELDIHDWPPEVIETALQHHFLVLRYLNKLEEQFLYAFPRTKPKAGLQTVLSRHDLFDSEFEYCFDRNRTNLMGSSEELRPKFDKVDSELRNFDTPSGNQIESVREFAEVFYEFIIALSFFMSSDKRLNRTYYNDFPESVTVLKIKDLIDSLDLQFEGGALTVMREQGELGTTTLPELNLSGQEVFGDDWEVVRNEIVMSPETPDAHPFLFAAPIEEEAHESPPGIQSSIVVPRVFYARDYASFIRFQMFPLLYDEDGNIGHFVLKKVTETRSEEYERNVHQYLQRKGFETYHSLKHYKANEHELDVLALPPDRDEVWFIECKYKLPKLRMNTSEGMRAYNKKMTEAVFEDGEPFDQKVDWWLENMPGDRFTTQIGEADEDRKPKQFEQSWEDLTVRRFVISNLVPSYPVKRGVVFLTGMEFVELVESDNLPYQPKHDYLVEGALP